MTQQLPTRPFTPLPPPPGGIAQAVRTGRRMRLRRRLAVAGGALTAVAVVAAAAVLGPASTGATDQLVPADQPSASPITEPVAIAPEPVTSSAVRGQAAPGAAAAGGAAAQAAPQRSTAPASPAAAGRGAAPASAYRTPNLIRTYRADAATGPVARYCGGTMSNDSQPIAAKEAGWCITAAAVTTSAGHDLALEVCRDSTGDDQLLFKNRREAELLVLLGDKVVWRWSTGHANPEERHTLATGMSDCWTWTARWTDVDAAGRPLEVDDYTLDVVSTATPLAGLHRQVPIQIR